ncbi:MAG TPA: FAD:protein FMN transferase [Solirubrobacterales bacterium]|jgi:thiamine biosynthesis lipoprotein|nr:FAD:protein FMN transferase [Solirubrobacterales bacterium]
MSAEAHRDFACFGGRATVHIRGETTQSGEEAVDRARERLLDAHQRLTRFSEDSELTLLNRDPRAAVPATELLQTLAAAVAEAGGRSDGLVDATLLGGIERAGYRESLGEHRPVSLAEALAGHTGRAPASPDPAARWRLVGADPEAGTIVRPPGVGIDSGGIAKGLVADLVAAELGAARAYAIDCCGDIRIGGSAGQPRRVAVDNPFGGGPLGELRIVSGAVATSGISRRCWVGPDGAVAHHILDPASGEPAFTGIVQATALAPSALLAEVYAKAALLAGPEAAARWLPHGGVLVGDDGEAEFVGIDSGTTAIAVAA